MLVKGCAKDAGLTFWQGGRGFSR